MENGKILYTLYMFCDAFTRIMFILVNWLILCDLGKCDLFGTDIDERPFIGLSAYDVKALTYCELQFIVLDKTVFDVLDLYPNYLVEFSNALHDELSFNIKEGYDPVTTIFLIFVAVMS